MRSAEGKTPRNFNVIHEKNRFLCQKENAKREKNLFSVRIEEFSLLKNRLITFTLSDLRLIFFPFEGILM